MVRTDEEVKLLLEALQMSVSSCMQMPDMAMLRSQMLARLMTVPRLQVGSPEMLLGGMARCITECVAPLSRAWKEKRLATWRSFAN